MVLIEAMYWDNSTRYNNIHCFSSLNNKLMLVTQFKFKFKQRWVQFTYRSLIVSMQPKSVGECVCVCVCVWKGAQETWSPLEKQVLILVFQLGCSSQGPLYADMVNISMIGIIFWGLCVKTENTQLHTNASEM